MDNALPYRSWRSSFGFRLIVATTVLAIAGCNPPLPDNTPWVTGDPVTAAEVVGHWFKLIGEGKPEIDVRPVVLEGVVSTLSEVLLEQIPDLSEDHPLYMHVSDMLDGGALGDVAAGTYQELSLPESQQVAPVEQEDGSLLFEGSDLARFLRKGLLDGRRACEEEEDPLAPFEIEGMLVYDLAVQLWLFRQADSDDLLVRVSAQAAVDVPLVGEVTVRVTVDGAAYLGDGPEADGLVEESSR